MRNFKYTIKKRNYMQQEEELTELDVLVGIVQMNKIFGFVSLYIYIYIYIYKHTNNNITMINNL
jgi:hypothetical protein